LKKKRELQTGSIQVVKAKELPLEICGVGGRFGEREKTVTTGGASGGEGLVFPQKIRQRISESWNRVTRED